MEQSSLFENESMPLANRVRPNTLAEFVGQEHLLGEGKILRQLILADQVPSMIFWGPPGVGKTTLAKIIASTTKANFIIFSAVTSGIKEIKEVMEQAEKNRLNGLKTILFVDEIHRFNKAQQDAFLPYVEKGSIILIGATTENPSFEINSALLSRCKVFVLQALTEDNIVSILKQAIKDKKGFGNITVKIDDKFLKSIAVYANGDARTSLNMLEMVLLNSPKENETIVVNENIIKQCLNQKTLRYDKNGEEHYNLISALHKSMRNSDPQAAIYWLTRMLVGGEDPLYIARRLIRFASEDIGLADPNALTLAVSCYQACHFIGMPECSVNLTEVVTYFAVAPKSNSLYVAYEKAKKDALERIDEGVPLHLRNAPTKLMSDLNYGKGYIYAHDTKEKLTTMQCLPDSLKNQAYYIPNSDGKEIRFKERLEKIDKWKKEHSKEKSE